MVQYVLQSKFDVICIYLIERGGINEREVCVGVCGCVVVRYCLLQQVLLASHSKIIVRFLAINMTECAYRFFVPLCY